MGILIVVGSLSILGLFIFAMLSFTTDSIVVRIVAGILALACLSALIIAINIGVNGTETGKRWKKDLSSEFDGGLNRTVTIYNQYGDVLRTYEGKMDIQSSEGSKVVFVMNDIKYMIYKGDFDTVIIEEHE